MSHKGYGLFQVIIIIIITAIVSGLTIGMIITKNDFGTSNINYYDVVNDEGLKKFIESYSKLSQEYYIDINKEELIDSAINGMTSFLDEKYTSFLNEDDAIELYKNLNSTYNGIGIVLMDNKVVYVVKDSPACKSNLLVGDQLLSVNGIEVEKGKDLSLYLNKDNQENILKVLRDSNIINVSITTTKIKTPSVFSYNIGDITYLNINSFSTSTYLEFKESLNNNINEKLIIDLRNNPGGYLSKAKQIASYFSQKGDIIYYIKDKNSQKAIKDEDNFSYNKKIIILVNKNTASAAEILTMALKNNNNAIIVGENTYGKGKIQQAYNLNDGSVLKYTTSYWLTSEKKCIDGIGIVPDYILSNTEEDIQLKKGIELLSK